MSNTYLNNLSNNDFLKIFLIKLEKKLLTILELQKLLALKTDTLLVDKKSYSAYYITLKNANNFPYVESYEENDSSYILSMAATQKLFLFLISETTEALFYIENSLINDKNIQLFYEFIQFTVKALFNVSFGFGNNDIEKSIEILKRMKKWYLIP